MAAAAAPNTTAAQPEHVDVLVIGGGISGISTAAHLRRNCPNKTFLVLERRDEVGGTWSLFQYPGIRSDSDMATFGFGFRPWNSFKLIAPGGEILDYLKETVVEEDLTDRIRFGQHVIRASFDSKKVLWTLTTATGKQYTSQFLSLCTGYYNYDKGHAPEFPGQDTFKGRVVHPQFWDPEMDYTDKKIVIIGSGATAATLLPSLVKGGAGMVTQLQRSPGYYMTLPGGGDPVDSLLRRVPFFGHRLMRWKYITLQQANYVIMRFLPRLSRGFLMAQSMLQLPKGCSAMEHFNPKYAPWDQRVCVVPDGDFYSALRTGKAQMRTDTIRAFTPKGILLEKSGEELEADIIVTATGLKLQENYPMSDMQVDVDGKVYNAPDAMIYKTMMVAGVPNLTFAVGYVNASWTLKADMIADHLTRILNHMDTQNYRTFCPNAAGVERDNSGGLLGLTSGYVMRAAKRFPGVGTSGMWTAHQSYSKDKMRLQMTRVDTEGLEFRV